MEPVPESSHEGESSEATLLDDLTALRPQRQVLRGQSHMSSERMEQCSSDGNSHPSNMASPPIPSEFDLLVVSPDLEQQERNYLGNNEEPSALESFPSPTLGLVTPEPGQSSHQAEIISTRPNQPETSLHQRGLLDGGNTSGQQAWKIGENHPDQSSPIPRPQTPFPHSAFGLVTQEPGQSSCQAEIISMQPNQPETSLHQRGWLDGRNTSGQQAWKIGGNHSDQSSPIPWPQTPFPPSAMGLGVGHRANDFNQTSQIPRPQTPFPHYAMGLGGGHGGPPLTNQQPETWATFNQTNFYEASSGTHQSISEAPSIPNVLHAQYSEAPIRFHQLVDESPIIPIALDAQYSSSVTPQQAMPLWSHAMSQQQINGQVLMDASNASAHAAIYESLLLPKTSIPYWQSLYPGQHVQPNQLPLIDVDPQSHCSTMHETSMIIGPQFSASYQPVNRAPLVQNFVNNSNAGTVFMPAASSIPQRVPFTGPLGFPNEAPPIIPNLNPGQSQFMNPEMEGGNYCIGNPYHLKTMDSHSEQESRKRSRFGDSTYEEGDSSSSSAKHFRLDGITQDQNPLWLTLGPPNSSSQLAGNNSGGIINSFGGIINRVYDPMYEQLGLPIDPHLRMFLASQPGNSSSSGQTATSQPNNQPQTWWLPDKRS